MCKVMMIPNVNDKNRSRVREFMLKVPSYLAAHPDNDGFGYAAITSDGHIFGEKWLKPTDAFNTMVVKKSKNQNKIIDIHGQKILKGTSTDKPLEEIYSKFGKVTEANKKKIVGVILHGRKTTKGGTNIQNTHPFVQFGKKEFEDIALIHNGTINNHEEEKFKKKYSTCDSEVILHHYLKNSVNNVPENIQLMADDFNGPYAVGVLTTGMDENGENPTPIMDIFKGHKPLTVNFIEELDTFVYCTKADTVKDICRSAGFNSTDIPHYELEDGALFRWDLLAGTPKFTTEEPYIQFKVGERYMGNSYKGGTGGTGSTSSRYDYGNTNNFGQGARTYNPPTATGGHSNRGGNNNVINMQDHMDSKFKEANGVGHTTAPELDEDSKKFISDIKGGKHNRETIMGIVQEAIEAKGKNQNAV